MTEKAILFDTTKCMACRACQVACKQWNGLKAETTKQVGTYENPPDLSSQTWLKMKFTEVERQGKPGWLFTRQACMHCTDATCIRVCPTNALYKNEFGIVAYKKDLCSGCGYCVDFCPFDVPRSNRSLVTGIAKMEKCTMCTSSGLDRVVAGFEPACVKTCPPGALKFGERDQLVEEGAKRVTSLKSQGFTAAYLYGEKDLGGLHVLSVLDDSPAMYKLPIDPQVPLTTTAWKNVIQPVGWIFGGLTLVGLALNYLIAREAKMSRDLPGKKETKHETRG